LICFIDLKPASLFREFSEFKRFIFIDIGEIIHDWKTKAVETEGEGEIEYL
jgi:hypothetical protein